MVEQSDEYALIKRSIDVITKLLRN